MSDISEHHPTTKFPVRREEKSSRIEFFDLREGLCKFPLGGVNDPVEWFCGAVTDVGSPYCVSCQQIAYSRPLRQR